MGDVDIMSDFYIVRISSHGEFINTPLYDELIKVPTSNGDITFEIYFRGEVGSTVLTRCNTLDTKTIDGEQSFIIYS